MNKFINLVFGCLLTSMGVILLGHAEIVTGGTAGLALSSSLVLDLPFYLLFFLINIPFYIFSVLQMGWNFTLLTILSVLMLSFMTFLGSWLPELTLNPLLAGLMGSIVIGFGLSTLFLNGSSLGGANILALYLQKKCNWDPGKVNFIFDFIVVLSGFYYLGLLNGIYSILTIAIYSSIISYFKTQIKEQNVPKEKKSLSLSTN